MPGDQATRPSAVELCGAGTSAAIAADAGAVRSHLEYILDEHAGALEPDQRRVLEAAWRNSRRILKFAEDLRDLALAESGELPLVHGRCDLRAVLTEAVRRSWPLAAVARKTIDVTVEGDLAQNGDPIQLARAVTAIVEHAVGHATAGTAISVHASDSALMLGFETAVSPLDDPLGLALASAVAKLHGGRLFVERSDGRTTLTLTFGPARAAKAA
jgi:signal transduction histidine kinase